jgi:aspartyl-tRNA(Asn)/glutamyl-tRNA(Gln) amidotransferase subunit C
MAVTREDVLHIAGLARLAVDEARIPELVVQLNSILGHMDVLSRVDTQGVHPAGHGGVTATPLRPDQGPQIPLHAPRESFAPEMRDGFFLVPRLATHEDAGDGGGDQ